MKSKKNNKNILLGSLSIIGLGSILGTSLLVTNNENVKPIDNTLISINENNSELLDASESVSSPTPRINQFLGTQLLKADVIALEWDRKTEITLQDWADWAPNVTKISPFAVGGVVGNAAFAGNKNIVKIEIPQKITDINYATFFDASNLTTVTFENDSVLEYIGGSAFAQTKLMEIDLPDSVYSIGASAFRYSHIQSIRIPNDVLVLRSETFAHSLLSSIIFGEGSQLITLEGRVFEGSKLTSIDLPNTVVSV
ncbi:MAG: leucine-rich repeat domain-containing protein, partial [Metamycoplasmataceae bacterium]